MNFLSTLFLLIGSYCPETDPGVKVYDFDTAAGTATPFCEVSGIENPSFLCISDDGSHVYAVSEREGSTSMLHHLVFQPSKASLQLLGARLTKGGAPCYVALAPDGRSVYTANYLGGSVTMFRRDANGTLSIGQSTPFIGHGVDAERQSGPHLHAINFTPDGKWMLANDLGTDRIHLFPKADDGTYPSCTQDFALQGGMGPRHLCFDAMGQYAYLLGEMSGEIAVLKYQPEAEHPLSVVQTVKADIHDGKGSADIHLSPDGHFLYASHRLKGDGISIFAVDAAGCLTPVGYQPTGSHPRNFTLSPDGRYLLVACRYADEVEIYERNPATGGLTDTGRRISTPKPVCLVFCER